MIHNEGALPMAGHALPSDLSTLAADAAHRVGAKYAGQ